jgi:multiple sugar transport system substrate-binding protein
VAEYLIELLKVSPPDILATTWYDRARIYARGGAAMAYCHTLLAHLFELDPASPAHGNTGYLPPPPGIGARAVSPLGGYAIAIPANIAPDRTAAVWEGVRVMTSPGAAKLFVANGSLASPRFSVNRDPEVAGLSPVIGIVDKMARDGVLRMWPRPPVDGISGVITAAGEEIHDMLQGHRTPREALARAQDRALRYLRNRGVYKD